MAFKRCIWELKPHLKDSEPVVLPRGITKVGRGPYNSIQCLNTTASRYHCEITLLDNGLIFIKDLGSLNGTFLGTTNIIKERDISLSNGDIIGIGVETRDLENDGMCIFHLSQKFLDKDELECGKYDNNVVPFNTLASDGFKNSDHNLTAAKSSVGINSESPIRLSSDSNASINESQLRPSQNSSNTKSSENIKNNNDGFNAEKSENQIRDDIFLPNGTGSNHIESKQITAAQNSCLMNDSSGLKNAGANAIVTPKPNCVIANVDSGKRDPCQLYSPSCGEERTYANSTVATAKQDIYHANEKNTYLKTSENNDFEVSSIKDVPAALERTENNISIPSKSTKQTLINTIQLKAVESIMHDSNNIAKCNSTEDSSLKSKIFENNDVVNEFPLTTQSAQILPPYKDGIVQNYSILENPSSKKMDPGNKTLLNSNDSVDLVQEHHTPSLICNTSNNNMDSIVQGIFNRRLSNSSDSNVNVNDQMSPTSNPETNSKSSALEKCTIDYSFNLNSTHSGEKCDTTNIQESVSSYKIETPSKVEPLVSESFTLDDDIITIDDDYDESLLPCSQMFEEKYEIDSDIKDCDIPFVDLTDDDDVLSEEDSSDEWFLRLSQCETSNIKTFDESDDSNEDELYGDKKEKTKKQFVDRNFESDEDISKGGTKQLPTQLEMSDWSSNESKTCSENKVKIFQNIEERNLLTETLISDSKSSLNSNETDNATSQATALSSNLDNVCLNSSNSKQKRKIDSNKLSYSNAINHDQGDDGYPLESKKIKKFHHIRKANSSKEEGTEIFHWKSLTIFKHSEKEKSTCRDLNETDDIEKTSSGSNHNDCSFKNVDSLVKPLRGFKSKKKNGKKEELNNIVTASGDGNASIIPSHQDHFQLDLSKGTRKPAWEYLIEEIVMFSDKWDEKQGHKLICDDVIDNKYISENTSPKPKEKNTVQEHENVVRTNTFLDINDLGTKSREAVEQSSKKSEETNLNDMEVDILEENTLDSLKDTCSKSKTAQETKLDEIQKKISAKYDKKPIPVVGAKFLPVKGKGLQSSNSKNIRSKNSDLDDTHKANFLKTKTKKINNTVPSLTPDKKAQRKSKLAEIALKATSRQNIIKKPKEDKSLKKAIKNTHKNRTEMFIDNLVPNNNTPKGDQSDNEECIAKKIRLTEYKIPRKNVINDDKMGSKIMVPNEPSCSKQRNEISDANITDSIEHKKIDKTINVIQTTGINFCEPQTLNYGVNKDYSTDLSKTGKTQKITIKKSNENSSRENISEAQTNSLAFCELKPILKLSNSENTLNNNSSTKKRVSFQHENLIVTTQFIEIEEGSSLKPVTKHVVKKDSPPQRPKELYFNYLEETLFIACRWNTMWFQEKNKVKGEPPVFTEQIYHMQDSFASYREYRRTLFPLMLYEMWAGLAREHDIVQSKNKPFVIEVQQISVKRIAHSFFPTLKDGDKNTLCKLDCQTVLEKSNQSMWPRLGDFVVLDIRMIDLKGKSFKLRILGYIIVCTNKAISSHTAVSQKLKARHPKASIVMDLSIYIRDDKFYKIDNTQDTRIAVLKNAKPEIRNLKALDCLSLSSMLNIICQPSINNLDLPLMLKVERSNYQVISHLNESQKKAVISVAGACPSNTDMIHFIHGPPGCGKSEVIISIIQMIFLAYVQNKLTEPPKILLCAPSNAAIDDIFMRLKQSQDKYKKIYKNKKLKMVRIGRTDSAHKNVKSMTLDCLVEKDLKKSREIFEDEQSRQIELKTLEAKKNQLNYQLENLGSKKNNTQYIRNVEMKLAETIKTIKELQKGKNRKALEGKELKEKKKERELIFLEGAHIIASTLSSCYNPQMEAAHLSKKLKVTCCIVDEATQCTEPEVLIPLMMGVRQLVLVGDPLQLPATVLSSTAKEHGFGRSLFARHRDWWLKQPDGLPKSRYHFLDTQYRMHPDIAKWPSEYFYDSSIRNDSSLEDRSLYHPLLPYVIFSHDFNQSNHEESNHDEAMLVEHLVEAINVSGLCADKTIGIITPYNRQKELLKGKLQKFDVQVGTVDSFQGQERDIIILSCVRTEGVGFMSGTERLNVALTRARCTMIICGNFKSLQGDSSWASLLNDARARGSLKTIDKSCRPNELFGLISKTN